MIKKPETTDIALALRTMVIQYVAISRYCVGPWVIFSSSLSDRWSRRADLTSSEARKKETSILPSIQILVSFAFFFLFFFILLSFGYYSIYLAPSFSFPFNLSQLFFFFFLSFSFSLLFRYLLLFHSLYFIPIFLHSIFIHVSLKIISSMSTAKKIRHICLLLLFQVRC